MENCLGVAMFILGLGFRANGESFGKEYGK